jgi:copper chaperone
MTDSMTNPVPNSMTTELQVSGMTCGHCQTAVTNALQAVPGVKAASVDLQNGLARVEGEAHPEALIAAVTEEGYGAQVRH